MKKAVEILQEAREAKGYTQTQLGDMIGLGLRAYQKIEAGLFPKYKTEHIKKIDEILGSNIYELIYEQKNRVTEESKEPYHKKRFEEKLKDKAPTITFYDVNASAGTAYAAEILPVKKGEGVLHISDLFKGSQYAIRISGNSMMPNYPPGAIIGIREITDKQIIPGSVYVIQKESDLWIKRLFYKDDDQDTGMVQCVSDNTMKFESGARVGKPAYPSFHIKVDAINKLFKVTGIYKSNELTVIS